MNALPKIQNLADYKEHLGYLQSHPSQDLIAALMQYAAENIVEAKEIVQIIARHLSRVPETFIIPLFYVIDATTKRVNGVFQTHLVNGVGDCPGIVDLFKHCYTRMQQPKLREDMMRLLSVWENAKLFPPDHLARMREVGTSSSSAAVASSSSVSASSHRKRPAGISDEHRKKFIGEEMQKLMNDAFGEGAGMTLRELYDENLELYAQLYAPAQATVAEKYPEEKLVKAFVAQTACVVNVADLRREHTSLRQLLSDKAWTEKASAVSERLAGSVLETVHHLEPLLQGVDQPPPLPPILSDVDTIPAEARLALLGRVEAREAEEKKAQAMMAAAQAEESRSSTTPGSSSSSSSSSGSCRSRSSSSSSSSSSST